MKFTKYDIQKGSLSIPKIIRDKLRDKGNIRFLPTTFVDKILNSKVIDSNKVKLIEMLSILINLEYHSSDLLKKRFGNRYSSFIRFFINNNIISDYEPEVIGDRARKYIFSKSTGVSIVVLDDFNDDIDLKYEKLDPIKDNILLESDIDVVNCLFAEWSYLYGTTNFEYKLSKRMNSVIKFKNGFRYKVISTKVGREYNSFCGLSKISREYVTYNGNKFHEVDMKNAVPYILSLIIDCEDDYRNDCSNGIFYDKLMSKILMDINFKDENYTYYKNGHNAILKYNDRDDIKIMVMKNILYGNSKNEILTKSFYNLYPLAAMSINYMKSDSENLSHPLFKAESYIILNLDLGIEYFTVHDAIYFTDISDKDYIIESINNRVKSIYPNSLPPKIGFKENTSTIYDITIDEHDGGTLFILNEIRERKPHKPHKNSNVLKIEQLKEIGYSISDVMIETGLSRKTVSKYFNKR
jgi:hypothetical protein